jgi:two-component system, chemotaxis family, chemotaxis protein CheY
MTVPHEYLQSLCLIVDDEASMRRTISNMLSRIGFSNILNADNGTSALSFIHGSKIDLVICDINMPEMSGMELFRIVRADRKIREMSFIFVTAEVRRNIVARAAEEGGGAYIIKPFIMSTLEDKIADVLRRRFKPTKFETHLKNYRKHMETLNIQRAEEEISAALTDDPTSPSLLFYMGQICLHKGVTDKAIHYFKNAIDRKPLFVKAYDALGKLYEDQGDNDEAMRNYETANRISSSNADRLVTLSKLHIRRGEKDKAMALLKQAAAASRQDVSISGHLIGELYLANGEYEKALEILANAHKQSPSDCSIMKSLAEACRKNGKPDEAIKIYEEILLITPHNADIYHYMGKTYLETGEKDTAIVYFTKAWEINPSSKEITRDLRALAEKHKIRL